MKTELIIEMMPGIPEYNQKITFQQAVKLRNHFTTLDKDVTDEQYYITEFENRIPIQAAAIIDQNPDKGGMMVQICQQIICTLYPEKYFVNHNYNCTFIS